EELVAGAGLQEPAEPFLGQPGAVVGCSVEQSHPAVPGGGEQLDRRAVRHRLVEVAGVGRTETETTEGGERSCRHASSTGAGLRAQVARVARSRPARRSATRSWAGSMPTDSRSSPSPAPATSRASGDIDAWVMVAGWATRLSVPPSDS